MILQADALCPVRPSAPQHTIPTPRSTNSHLPPSPISTSPASAPLPSAAPPPAWRRSSSPRLLIGAACHPRPPPNQRQRGGQRDQGVVTEHLMAFLQETGAPEIPDTQLVEAYSPMMQAKAYRWAVGGPMLKSRIRGGTSPGSPSPRAWRTDTASGRECCIISL